MVFLVTFTLYRWVGLGMIENNSPCSLQYFIKFAVISSFLCLFFRQFIVKIESNNCAGE